MTAVRERARAQRRDPGRARVEVRDRLILSAVARWQPLHVGQIVALLDMSVGMARRRLGILKDLGLVRVIVTAQEEPNRYLLAIDGAAELGRIEGRSMEDYRTPKALPKADLAHHDATVDVVIALEVAALRSERFRIARSLIERDIRQLLGGTPKGALIPDALVELELPGGARFALAIEADENHEKSGWFARKMATYGDLQATGQTILGCAGFRVLVVTPHVRRANRLAVAAWEAGIPEGLGYFAAKEAVTPSSILDAVWWTPRMVGEAAELVAAGPLEGVITNRRHRDHGFQGSRGPANASFPAPALGRFRRGDAP